MAEEKMLAKAEDSKLKVKPIFLVAGNRIDDLMKKVDGITEKLEKIGEKLNELKPEKMRPIERMAEARIEKSGLESWRMVQLQKIEASIKEIENEISNLDGTINSTLKLQLTAELKKPK
ncbi:MAG: hypothetical protein V1492_04810 [Candidatus Micrarchaeota archaeon]